MRRMRFMLGIGLSLGLLLTLVRMVFGIDQDTFMNYYWIVGTIMVVIAALFYALRTSKSTTEMNKAVNLLNEGKAEEYIRIVEKLQVNAKTEGMRNLLRLNLTAGYCDLEDYETAINILEELRRKKLRGEMDLVWRLNLCYAYFCNGDNDVAMEIYEENEAKFEEAKAKGKHQVNLMILEMFVMMERGQYVEARKMLKDMKRDMDIPRLQRDYKLIDARLNELNM